MHRQALLQQLQTFQACNQATEKARQTITDFVTQESDCFQRSLAKGHLTASGFLLDTAGEKVLLTLHRKLGMWLQLGGHADGDNDLLRVALKEAQEESGLKHIEPVSKEIFDLDVHLIPAHGNDPAHYHYDIRFLLQATDENEVIQISEESNDLAWFSPQEAQHIQLDNSVKRMFSKLKSASYPQRSHAMLDQ